VGVGGGNTAPVSEWFKKGGPYARYWSKTEDEIAALAEKKNISIDEWIFRDMCVRKSFQTTPFWTGMVCYPRDYDEFMKYGAVTVVGVTKSYEDFGDRDWPESNEPLIHLVRCDVTEHGMLNTTTGWLSRIRPVKIEEEVK
jgi:hypothetical protein